MIISGLHLLLTYQCTFECDHCFVWSSPSQPGVMNLVQVHEIMRQARELEGLEWIYFEGGEPFLYFPILLRGVQLATAMGFQAGVVTNAYWATTPEDALAWLKPLSGLIADLSISGDRYHDPGGKSLRAENALAAAKTLGIPVDLISVAQPASEGLDPLRGQIPPGESAVMFRGRAAELLAPRVRGVPWDQLDSCPHEDLVDPGRVHLDPFGNIQICQGITLGNIFERPLKQIFGDYHAADHPICGPLLRRGPRGLVEDYHLLHEETYADACHLCYASRLQLRDHFPSILTPAQVYGLEEPQESVP